MPKVKMLAVTALVFGFLSGAGAAQTPRSAEYAGSTWGYYLLRSGMGMGGGLGGGSFGGPTEITITIVNRDGVAISEVDRTLAIGLARGLCEQQGRHFNTQTRGHWLPSGGLGFQGACTEW